MTLYKKEYRVETTRLPGHTYADGTYFVTICTKKKLQWFGEIVDKKMELNELGEIVKNEWLRTPKIRPYVKIDAWCVMPNHIHGIMMIENVETCGAHVSERTETLDKQSRTEKSYGPMSSNVETCGAHVSLTKTDITEPDSISAELKVSYARNETVASETRATLVSTKTFFLQPKGLGSILNQFKGTVTKQIHSMGYPDFSWQTRYHDRVIRSEEEREALKKYINSNPEHWDKEAIPWHADAASWSQ